MVRHFVGTIGVFVCLLPLHAETLYVGAQRAMVPIYIYDGSGTATEFAPQASMPLRHLAVDSGGNLYVAYQAANTVWKYSPSGAGAPFASSGLDGPYGLAFDNTGNVFVSNRGTDSILKFTLDGTGSTFADAGLSQPMSLAFRGGTLYAADITGAITIFDDNGTPSLFAQLESGAFGGLVFDRAGNLFAGTRSYIYKITPDATVSVLVDFISLGLFGPTTHGLAIDGSDNLFVSDFADTVWKVTPNGDMTVFANQSAPSFMVFVPEPTSMVLLPLGFLALVWRRRC